MQLRVCIVQPVVPTYRTPVFNALGRVAGIDLTVFAGRSSPGAPSTDEPSKFVSFSFAEAPTRQIGPFFSQPAQFEVIRNGFDVIIYSWNSRYLQVLPALLLARRAKVGSVLWGHGLTPTDGSCRRAVRCSLAALGDAALVYSESIAESLRQHYGMREKVFVALNAIDQSPIQAARSWWSEQPGALEEFRIQRGLGESQLIVFLARLRPAKKAECLLRVLALLLAEGRDVRVAVIGDGSERGPLETLAKELGIFERVLFLGALYDEFAIAPWCLSAVACVVPSSIGLSLLHAFGYGLPVVAAASGSGPEIEALRNGDNGIVTPPGDAGALLRELRSLLDDPPRQERLGRAAADTVSVNGFSLPHMVDGMVAAINYAAESRGRHG